MMAESAQQAPSFTIQVIQLGSEQDAQVVLSHARQMFAQHGVEVETDSHYVPAIVGELAGFVALVQMAAPVVGHPIAGAISGALAGEAIKQFIAWLKERHKVPRVNSDVALAIATADIEGREGLTTYEMIRRRTLLNCDKPLAEPHNCFVFVFQDTTNKRRHTYVISNEGEITSYELS